MGQETVSITHTTQDPGAYSAARIEDEVALLRAEVAEILGAHTGLKPAYAEPLAAALVEGLRERLGGQLLYIPTNRSAAKAKRDARIRAEFNGRNRDEVCARHGISRSSFYGIVNRR